jgi:hypothetical protein
MTDKEVTRMTMRKQERTREMERTFSLFVTSFLFQHPFRNPVFNVFDMKGDGDDRTVRCNELEVLLFPT